MLACIQRRQNFPSQHLNCSTKSVMASAPPLLLPAPHLQPGISKGEPAPMVSRYPSPAELDAFAQKTARSPLTIKIFQTEVRVPQHKQLNKTVNGLDTTGQSYSSYPYSGGYQGLLAIVKASVTIKGVLKNSDGKRTKHSNGQASMAPYSNAMSNTYRHGHKAYHTSSCKSSDVPTDTQCSSTRVASGDPSRLPQAELAQVQSLMRQMSRNPHREAPQLGGEARTSPSVQAAAAVAPQSGVTYAGAVLPTQTAGMAKAVYLDKADYRSSWQPKQQQTQQYQQRAVRMYNAGNGTHIGQSPESVMSLAYPSQLSYRLPPPNVQERGSASSLNCMQGDISTGPYFASLWDNNITSTPNSDNSYQSQLLATGICAARPRDLSLSNHHPKCHHLHHHQTQHPALQPHPHSQQAYSADQNLTGGLPTSSLCHAAMLSSSLQSLECLISEIQPPCIKERMLGRGYQAMGMPLLLEHHHQQSHIQLPVYR
ncbi:protein FAM222A-like [Boleophthalmus pectinirostris]|uniref:protein FAM222A-like n=1 Tax=Boleophthalmus pectinirostris TaxID=150288 RepID=UPI000A1C523C|nr:protein FAM222A-like [Boleophthalmus pectinirostris]XP_020780902.1 protein FAM222A-like [Boleophthalmus pectinirostris]XP_020780903.1 protein FAM222A-like [Boleophthalmus pectinirostris]XP_055009976.1 protein FAM222A-like [Boleophthalmus pectinirostris]